MVPAAGSLSAAPGAQRRRRLHGAQLCSCQTQSFFDRVFQIVMTFFRFAMTAISICHDLLGVFPEFSEFSEFSVLRVFPMHA